MKKTICLLILVLTLLLSACGAKANTTEIPTLTEPVATTEPEIELDPEWLTEAAIDEAISHLFPSEGQINVQMAQELLFPLVEAGNAKAQYYWGYIYDLVIADSTGEGEKEALYWYKHAAEQGYSKAYLAISANGCLNSQERKMELTEAAKQAGLFEIPPEELGPDGCEYVAVYYIENNDHTAAMEWFQNAAEQNSSIGMLNVGLMHYYGLGVEQNYITALDWILKAANLGNAQAMYWYGYLLSDYAVAETLINHSYTASFEQYLADAQAGDPEAMYKMGVIYDNGYCGFEANTESAFEWYKKAADAGHMLAAHIMASAYRHGFLGCEQDYALAVEWYKKAADAGGYLAMEELGVMYITGEGVDENQEIGSEWIVKSLAIQNEESYYSDRGDLLKTALEWHKKAADAGFVDSMIELGYYLESGQHDFFINYVYTTIYIYDAMEWYQKAANMGSEIAMYNLGRMYEFDYNYDAAMEWYIKAYAHGYSDAAEKIYEMLVNKQGLNGYYENYGELVSANS